MIDARLTTAGWNRNDSLQVGLEIPVDGAGAEPWNGVTDYCLYQPNGEIIAVVEAKRTSRDPRVAIKQINDYVTEIEKGQSFRPFAFMASGLETYFERQLTVCSAVASVVAIEHCFVQLTHCLLRKRTRYLLIAQLSEFLISIVGMVLAA
ncbi:MAG: hypothetical protein HYR56_00365 [Acidobacteria bacterium]|nr:hypothetical protein [Acidobacteriota bacterium]MBI3422356.1 hypothetical protein [Acidobacteriota bacterium]